MTAAVLLAAFAGALAVAGAWEVLAAVEHAAVVRFAQRMAAPVLAAGRAGREPTAPERRRLAWTVAATLLAGGWVLSGPLAGALLALGGPLAATRLLAMRRARWRRRLAQGAPAAARALADALSGGHSVRGAIGEAAGSGAVMGPAGVELRDAAATLALGERTEAVLERLRVRAADPAWDTVLAAILLQRETGGDLARLLREIAISGEEARRVEGDARSATAQARFTAQLVAGMPLAGFALAELAQPGYVVALAGSPLTLVLVVSSAGLSLVALVAVGRIARVETS